MDFEPNNHGTIDPGHGFWSSASEKIRGQYGQYCLNPEEVTVMQAQFRVERATICVNDVLRKAMDDLWRANSEGGIASLLPPTAAPPVPAKPDPVALADGLAISRARSKTWTHAALLG